MFLEPMEADDYCNYLRLNVAGIFVFWPRCVTGSTTQALAWIFSRKVETMFGCKRCQGSSRRLVPVLLPLPLILVITVFHTTARADTITLTGGQVVLNSNLSSIGVDLMGPNFSLHS